jgi:hypothetical protein
MNSTTATDYTKVGVKVGDTADYKTASSVSSDNKTRIYVIYISGTIVTADYMSFFPNGTLHSSTSWTGNISSYEYPIYLVLLAAGLKTGDHLGTDPSSPTIDVNTTLNTAGTSRLANHAHATSYLGVLLLSYLDAYWDQQTGLLIQGNFFALGLWLNFTLISTTVFSSGSALNTSTIALVEGVVIVVLVIAMVLVARRGGKHRK